MVTTTIEAEVPGYWKVYALSTLDIIVTGAPVTVDVLSKLL